MKRPQPPIESPPETPAAIAADRIEEVRREAAAQPPPKRVSFTRHGAVRALAQELLAMHEAGHNWPWIADWLTERGIKISRQGLRNVMRGVRRRLAAQSVPAPARSGDGQRGAAPPRTYSPAALGAPRMAGAVHKTVAASTDRTPSPSDVPPGTFVIRPDTPDL